MNVAGRRSALHDVFALTDTLRGCATPSIHPPLFSQTPLAPTSWAIVCMWKRFFRLQDEEEERHLALVAEALEALQPETAPIDAPAATRLRREFAAEHRRDLRTALQARVASAGDDGAAAPPSPLQAALQRLQTEQAERLARNRPDLGVPREDGDFMYYAQ